MMLSSAIRLLHRLTTSAHPLLITCRDIFFNAVLYSGNRRGTALTFALDRKKQPDGRLVFIASEKFVIFRHLFVRGD
jgi:hypothetical protein